MSCQNSIRLSSRYLTPSSRSSWTICKARSFTTTHGRCADEPTRTSQSSQLPPTPISQRTAPAPARNSVLDILSGVQSGLGSAGLGTQRTPDYGLNRVTSLAEKFGGSSGTLARYGDDEYHLHIFFTKHNTHITLASPERKSLISISAGNLGFRKSQRGSYDAAFQSMSYVISRLQQQGILVKINKLELCLRGFGQGREAVMKVIQGIEGTRLREALVRIVDKTRLKIGGTRSKAPRRLG